MNYHTLYDLDQDDTAITSVGNDGLGMNPSERASVPSYNSRTRKKSATKTKRMSAGTKKPGTLSRPSTMNTAPTP
jgi:hypothetical protein